jgi:hypothetical protein
MGRGFCAFRIPILRKKEEKTPTYAWYFNQSNVPEKEQTKPIKIPLPFLYLRINFPMANPLYSNP